MDKKINYLESFENRRNQILGLNGVFLSLLWGTWSESRTLTLMEIFFIILYLLAFFIQIPYFILLSMPRKAKISLQLLDSLDQSVTNLIEYYNQLNSYLGEIAIRTRRIYRLFFIEIVSLLGLFIFKILSSYY